MNLQLGESVYEVTSKNSAVFTGETLLNGLYVDLDDNYAFVPASVTNYAEIQRTAEAEGVLVYELDSYDPISPPYCFMINALCRAFRYEVDELVI